MRLIVFNRLPTKEVIQFVYMEIFYEFPRITFEWNRMLQFLYLFSSLENIHFRGCNFRKIFQIITKYQYVDKVGENNLFFLKLALYHI